MTTTIDATTRLDATTNEHPATMSVLGYASPGVKAPLGPFRFDRREPRPDDVVIDILYCGICHSDVHHVRGTTGEGPPTRWCRATRSSGASRASARTSRAFKVGDHAGVGCLVDSCGHCAACKRGMEQCCERGATLTYNDVDRHDGMRTFGGYSERIVVTEKFVLQDPGRPRLGRGAAAVRRHHHLVAAAALEGGRGQPVAVVGPRRARAHGAEVGQGAGRPRHAVHPLARARRTTPAGWAPTTSSCPATRPNGRVAGRFDLIIDTVPYVHDLNPYVPTLALDGTLVMVGFLGTLDPSAEYRAAGDGAQVRRGLPHRRHRRDAGDAGLLRRARHHVGRRSDPDAGLNEAYERMLKSDVKYRFVIDLATLDDEA